MRISLMFLPLDIPFDSRLNMLPLNSLMTCLDSLLGYSTGEFHALQPIAPMVSRTVD